MRDVRRAASGENGPWRRRDERTDAAEFATLSQLVRDYQVAGRHEKARRAAKRGIAL